MLGKFNDITIGEHSFPKGQNGHWYWKGLAVGPPFAQVLDAVVRLREELADLRDWGDSARAVIESSRACRIDAEKQRDELLAKVDGLTKESQERSTQVAELAVKVVTAERERDAAIASHKNMHRNLCERFSYRHDERDWFRDQISLEEHIAKQVAQKRAPLAMLSQLEPDRAFWYCYRLGGSAPTHRHPTEESARVEADRLARAHGGVVQILAAVAEVEFASVRWTEFAEAPF